MLSEPMEVEKEKLAIILRNLPEVKGEQREMKDSLWQEAWQNTGSLWPSHRKVIPK